jgi:hypothetical protein
MSTPLPPAAPVPVGGGPGTDTWGAGPPSRRARRRTGKLTVFVALLALGLGVAVGALGGAQHEQRLWKPKYERELADASRWRTSSSSWRAKSNGYQSQLESVQGQLESLQTKVTNSVGNLDHPQFTLWNVRQSLGGGSQYLFGSVPDTFSWSLDIRSTLLPIKVLVMTNHDYACWASNACYAHWRYWGPSTHIDATWDAARGCAGYVFVITSSGPTTVIPQETITRDPASKVTGTCRG